MEAHNSKRLFFILTSFILGSFIFIIGFFPCSYDVISNSNEGNFPFPQPSILGEFILHPPGRKYNQTILIIVDALRYDFTTLKKMPYSYNSSCNRIKLRVDIPTVTMPRIKSLTTGTVSNFMDIVLNLGHAEQLEGSILHNLVKRGDKIVFTGDQTWVNLFPNEFHRQFPNTDSFFVGDFYEGDKNVTNILRNESYRLDWSFLIAHYLGLDHIGHVEGTSSAKLPGKLKEMDDVIREMSIDDRLLIVTGDHGMRNGGGHGGSTKEEMFVPLLTFYRNCKKRNLNSERRQIDIAPTLSILLSTEIPRSSIGCIISELIDDFSMEDQLYSYYYNAFHLMEKVGDKFDFKVERHPDFYKWFKLAKNAHKEFLRSERIFGTKSSYFFEEAKMNYIRSSSLLSSLLAKSRVNFDFDLITIGLLLSTVTTTHLLLYMFLSDKAQYIIIANTKTFCFIFFFAILFVISGYYIKFKSIKNYLISGISILSIGASIYLLFEATRQFFQYFKHSQKYSRTDYKINAPLWAGIFFYVISLTATSYIEEEHQTWYYLGSTYIIGLYSKKFHKKFSKMNAISLKTILTNFDFVQPCILFTILIILRRMNQSGNKWQHLEDIGDILRKTNNKVYLSLILFSGLLYISIQALRQINSGFCRAAYMLCVLSIYIFRGLSNTVNFMYIPFLNDYNVLCVFWTCVVIGILNDCKNLSRKEWNLDDYRNTSEQYRDVCHSWMQIILALFLNPHNVILLPIMNFLQRTIYSVCDDLFGCKETVMITYKTILTYFFVKMFYFYQGNSNSFATIDLTPGFIGQSKFNAVIAVPFITLNTFCASFNGFFYFIHHMKKTTINVSEKKIEFLPKVFTLYTIVTLLPITCYFWYLILFRYHLFIYSVFAPKVFYDCYNVIVYYLMYSFITMCL